MVIPVPNYHIDAQPMQYGSTIMSDVPGRGNNTCRQRVNDVPVTNRNESFVFFRPIFWKPKIRKKTRK